MTAPRGRRPVRLTPRGWAILGLAVVLYLFANQTQVNWLYVFTALTLGVWAASAVAPGAMLRALTVRRWVNGAEALEEELAVGDPVAVTVTVHNRAWFPALQVRGLEVCPLAARAERRQPFFLEVPGGRTATLRYAVTAARRGWHTFPPVAIHTGAPFGFFAAQREAAAPTGVLVFPAYRTLQRFPLLDRRPATHNPFARVGQGGEFLGVREYRPGDSPRHVHWRSTARVGRLVVKEFAEETQPGLTVVVDLRATAVIGDDDDNTLERALQAAATLAHYADGRGLPLTLAANSRAWPAPLGPVSRWAALNYLARVQAEGDQPLADCLRALPGAVFVAAVLPQPDPAVVAPLSDLKRQGVEVLAVLIDPASFAPERAGEAAALAGALQAAEVNVRVIGAEADWHLTLAADDRAAPRY